MTLKLRNAREKDKEAVKGVQIMASGIEAGCVFFIKSKDMKDAIVQSALKR